MRWLAWVVALALAAALLAMAASGRPGNVAILLPPYRIDLSLNLTVLLLLVGFVLFYVAIRAFSLLLGLPRAAALFRSRRRKEVAANALHESVMHLLGGRFRRAERAAGKAAETDAFKPGALLTAAQAAQAMQAYDRRDAYLEALPPAARETGILLQAQWQVEARDVEAAQAALRRLSGGMQRRTQTMRLALAAARALKDHGEVLRLATTLRKHHGLHPAAAQAMLHGAALGLIRQANHDAEALRPLWKSFDPALRHDPQIAAAAARGFYAAGESAQARSVLVDTLRASDAEPAALMPALRSMLSGIDAGFVAQAEAWMDRWPQEAQATFLAARACAELELWGKAQQYLHKALDQCQPDERKLRGQIHAALARLQERIEREGQAARHWRLAAQDLSTDDASAGGSI